MRKLSTTLALQQYILDLLYLQYRLAANPRTEALAPYVAAQVEKLDGIKTRIEQGEREQMRFMAKRDAADDGVDELIRSASKKAEAEFGSRESPDFQRLLARPQSELVALPIAEEVVAAQMLSEKLETCGVPELAALAAPLRTAALNLRAAEDAWKGSYQPVALAAADREYEKANANLLREKTYGHLVATFPGQRARAEAYFRETRVRAAGGRDEEQAEPVTPPTPA